MKHYCALGILITKLNFSEVKYLESVNEQCIVRLFHNPTKKASHFVIRIPISYIYVIRKSQLNTNKVMKKIMLRNSLKSRLIIPMMHKNWLIFFFYISDFFYRCIYCRTRSPSTRPRCTGRTSTPSSTRLSSSRTCPTCKWLYIWTSAPIGAWQCNFSPLIVTDRPSNPQTDSGGSSKTQYRTNRVFKKCCVFSFLL